MTDRQIDRREAAWVHTACGAAVSLLEMQPADVYMLDIAAALSKIARYNGHTTGERGYSVAQHSVLCADLIRVWGGDAHLEREALLHDAGEAYYGDVTWPVQMALGEIHREMVAATIEAVRDGWKYAPRDGDDVAHQHDGRQIESAVSGALDELALGLTRDPLRELKNRVDTVVRKALKLAEHEPVLVKRADMVALAIERVNLMAPCERDWRLVELADPRFVSRRRSRIEMPGTARRRFLHRLASIESRIGAAARL